MAKLKGILKPVGTLDGITIYKTGNGYVVRKAWGPDSARLKSDPAYKAIRHHQTEFGECTKAAKLLRDALMPILEGSLDNRVSPRLNKVMNSIKNLDTKSKPGKRTVSNGFATAKGRSLLKGFEFNIHGSIGKLLIKPYHINTKQQQIRFEELNPKKDLRVPKGATHLVLQCGLAVLDFAAKRSSLKEDSVVLPVTPVTKDLVLSFRSKSQIKGLKVLVLKLAFLQEVGGEQKALNDGRYNAVEVVGVWA